MSSQCVGRGASHLSKLDSNNLLPIDHRNESTPTVGKSVFWCNAIAERKNNIKFHIKCQLHTFFTIAEFTDNKTLTGRILVLIEISKIPEINYRSVVYLSLN